MTCRALLSRVRRRADTTYLMSAAAITGIAGLIVPGAKSLAISNTLNGVLEVVWFAGIALGGLVGLTSILIGGRLGLILERPVRWLLAFLCVAFGTAVWFYAGVRGIASIAFVGMFGVACLFASWEVRVRLKTFPDEIRLDNEIHVARAELASLQEEFRLDSSPGP